MGINVAGFSTLASSHDTQYDGFVNEAGLWASSCDDAKVGVHEIGHYLNLLHTFTGGCTNDNCATESDLVCDTPPDNSTDGHACGNTFNSCTTDVTSGFATDVNDYENNYMDYSFQNCQNSFTPGQKVRMHAALFGIRSSLLSSLGCAPVLVAEANLSNMVFPATNVCSTTFAPIITLSNNGTGNITSAVINYQIDGGTTGQVHLHLMHLSILHCLRALLAVPARTIFMPPWAA